MERTDLPEATRRQLDHQRKEFVRYCGRAFEELLEHHCDPVEWMAYVKREHDRMLAEAIEHDRAA